MLFECHITVYPADKISAGLIAEAFKWKTSQIDGDPVLGKKVFFYLTKYFDDFQMALGGVEQATAELRDLKVHVVREKIEMIVYDKRHPDPATLTST